MLKVQIGTNLCGKYFLISTACFGVNYTRYLFIQRETPEEDLKPEDYQQFRDVGAACLSGGDGQQLLKFIQDEKNQVTSLIL